MHIERCKYVTITSSTKLCIQQFSQHFVLHQSSDTLVRKAVEVGR